MLLKMNARRLMLAIPFLFISFVLFAQAPVEDCNNGIDDDGDGLIDCFDTDCTCTGQCDDFYYTTCNADCYYVPPCGQISLGIQWSSDAETGTYSPMVAGDMDGDGIPDIVTTRNESPDLYVIDGATGLTKVHVMAPTVWPGGTAPAIADLDHDGLGEIVIVGFDRLLYCYEHDGTLKFTSSIQVGYQPRYRYSVPNIADFDHDGWAEINIGNQVFSGQTGALLAQGGSNVSAGEHPARAANGFSFASPVAMDVLPDAFCPDCAGLEIVAGNQVLSVNLATGAVTPVVSAFWPVSDGFTSVADFDGDGDLDAIVQGRNIFTNANTVFVWDIQTPFVLRQYKLINNWAEGASRVNVADLNGDGRLEVSFVSHPRLYALNNDFSVLWTRPVDDASAITCSSIFDFCGDGSADIVYRDQEWLRVIDGATGAVSFQDQCLSATHIEAPLILDVDADGQTEVVIQCGTNGGSSTGTVVVYEAIGTPDITSRKVWNQHGYFNTNINEDLSVPQYQQNPHVIGDSLVMNTFMNQYFNPTFPSPDGAISFQNVSCNRDSMEISLEICNVGDNIMPAQTPISAYLGNPQTTAATWIGSAILGADINLGACDTLRFNVPRYANDTIFLVLNDDNSTPTPFNLNTDFPVTAIGECGFGNNIASFYYLYLPAVVDLGLDTAICDNTSIQLDVSGNQLVGWQWSTGDTTSSLSIAAPGVYAVSVTDVCNILQTDTILIAIDSSTVVNIGIDQSLCKGETVAFSESGFDFYNWASTASLSCTGCANVTVSPANSTLIILEAGFSNGCVNRDSAYITVFDTFYHKVDTLVCWGGKVNYNGQLIPADSSATFFLQTVHGCDSTVQVRVAGTALGTFNHVVDTAVCLGKTLSYLGFDLEWGAEKSFNLSAITGCDSTVLVRVAPLDTFYLLEDRTICYGEFSEIFGQQQNTSGVYNGKFTATNGCDSTHVISLSVLPQIQLEIDATPACFGESNGALSVAVPNGVNPLQFAWSFAGPQVPQAQNLPPGDYSLTVTDGNDCTETKDVTVESYPAYIFEANADSVSCFGLSDGAISVESPDPGLTFSLDYGPFMQTPLFGNLRAGTYDIRAEDIYGCQDTVQVSVQQPPLLVLDLPQDTTIQLGVSLPLNIGFQGLSPVSYVWSDTSYLSCAACPEPVVQVPLQTVRYMLTITDKNGCSASDEMLLTVDQVIGVYIPNAIGGGGENSRFELNFGPSVQKINLMRVFDRWGSLLHEVRDAFPGDATITWDGRYKGSLVNPGVYVWMIELELVNGVVVQKKGDLTVVR